MILIFGARNSIVRYYDREYMHVLKVWDRFESKL